MISPYTNNPDIDQYIRERIESLPEKLTSAINDASFFKSVDELLAPQELSSQMLESIKYEVLLIMMGFSHIEDLPVVLIEEYGLSVQQATEINSVVTNQMLSEYTDLLNPESETGWPAASEQEREQIEFRPKGVAGGGEDATEAKTEQPITREELASYLKPKRTMHDDVAAIQDSASEPPQQQTKRPADTNEEAAAEHPETPEDIPQKPAHDAAIPRYARPLTDTPKYSEDDA